MKTPTLSKPPWLTRRLPNPAAYERVRRLIDTQGLHTVCQEALCPNQFECFSRQTATFLILGAHCTRNCGFCNVAHGPVVAPDMAEPEHVAAAARRLNLKYVVVTSVTRDDLADGGAGLFAATIRSIRNALPHSRVEVLIPDFQGDAAALDLVLAAGPDVLNHNLETVPRLYAAVRPQAQYGRSLALLQRVSSHAPQIISKSGLMLGLGESAGEIRAALRSLRQVNCQFLTLGQYLQPSARQLPVARYVPPEEFVDWRHQALDMGFAQVASGPLVRSSYQAHELFGAAESP